LTCDFWAENEERICKNKQGKDKADRALRDEPTLSTMKLSRRWGTQVLGDVVQIWATRPIADRQSNVCGLSTPDFLDRKPSGNHLLDEVDVQSCEQSVRDVSGVLHGSPRRCIRDEVLQQAVHPLIVC
jgi:hypothetical protein